MFKLTLCQLYLTSYQYAYINWYNTSILKYSINPHENNLDNRCFESSPIIIKKEHNVI